MHHGCIYENFTATHHLVGTTHVSTWGGIKFLNYVYPIITSPDSNIAPQKPPSDDYFIRSLWSSLTGVLVRILFYFIT